MTTDPDDKRSLIITGENEGSLLEGLARIPGYSRVELEDSVRHAAGRDEQRFCLETVDGEQVVVRHKRGEATAYTVNVLKQDAGDAPVAIHADEVVRLHRAIKEVDGLYSQVVAAEIDLVAPSD